MKRILFIAALCLIAQNAYASKMGVLSFSRFAVESEGIGDSGKVSVQGVKDGEGRYREITITAFGKVFQVPESVLNQIPAKYQNGIETCYEAGYAETGGRTVYVMFFKGFTGDGEDKVLLSVSENGAITITPLRP
ncbi:MAG: hypothetical protein AB1921_09850 [Thermodesulfobacteriota bacterium]